MDNMTAALEEVGMYGISELSRQTTVPKETLRHWIRQGWLPVVRVDGMLRTTVHAARLAAEEAARDGRGVGKRTWEIEPANTDKTLRAPAK